MECNKDEAIRAVQVAERKLQDNDFTGARKMAQLARRLFPDLENIIHLLTVCEVHCSAQNKINGSEVDWYGILQIQQSTDDATIRKQYRKFALLLHPDKNKFPGAEAAFKLIGEANRLLSDHGKRSLYDMRCRALQRTAAPKPPQHQTNANTTIKQHNGTTSNFQGGPRAQLNNMNSCQPPQQHTFWTACPFCGVRYQYLKIYVNQKLRCQSCCSAYIALDLGNQNVPSGSHQSQSTNQKVAPDVGPQKAAAQCKGSEDRSAGVDSASKTNNDSKTFPGSGAENTVKEDVCVHAKGKKGGSDKPMSDAAKTNTEGSSGKARGKRRKLVAESSESCDSIDDSKEEISIKKNVGDRSRQRSGITGNQPKRSSRNSLPTPDEETGGNVGVSEVNYSSARATVYGGIKKQKTCTPCDEGLQDNNGTNGDASDINFKGGSIQSQVVVLPDAEFNDFEKYKKEQCFAVNQLWAIYDTNDGMPRFYACIKKVFPRGFKVKITWLEPALDNAAEKDWSDKELPVGCGKYTKGTSEETEDTAMFSHLIQCIRGNGRGSYLVYPLRGETWALFKDWDIKWTSDPDKHVPYNFEFVEVMSDFSDVSGIEVAYLGKVEGFVSLFQHLKNSSQIPSNELYRFSHRIPSFKLTGVEREGVPKGSFEFDTAALPSNLFELGDHGDSEMENGGMGLGKNGSTHELPESKAEDVIGSDKIQAACEHKKIHLGKKSSQLNIGEKNMTKEDGKKGAGNFDQSWGQGCVTAEQAEERINTPMKHFRNGAGSSMSIPRSPRDLGKKSGELFASDCMNDEGKQSDTIKDEKYRNSKRSYKHSGESSHTPGHFTRPGASPKVSRAQLYDFNREKSVEYFLIDQIWALYSDEDGMPKIYAQVKRIVISPSFHLYVVLLEPEVITQPSCGIFKVKNGKTKVLPPSAFSHSLKSKQIGKNRYEIYPRKGEIWALYKNWNFELTVVDMKMAEYDMVEVLDDDEQKTSVMVLNRVDGFKLVYKAPRIQRSRTGIIEIPKNKLARFSHKIPAFLHLGEFDSRLRGCWELDSLAVPGIVSCL